MSGAPEEAAPELASPDVAVESPAARIIYPPGSLEPCRKCAEKGIDFKCKASEWRAHAMVEHPRGDPDSLEPCRKCLEKGIDFKCTAAEFRAHAVAEHPREKKSPAAKKVNEADGGGGAANGDAMAVDAAPKKEPALQVCRKCAEKGIEFKCTRAEFREHAAAEHPRGDPDELMACRKCAEKGIEFKCTGAEWRAHAVVEHPREPKAKKEKAVKDPNANADVSMEGGGAEGGEKKKRQKKRKGRESGAEEGDGQSPEKAQKAAPAASPHGARAQQGKATPDKKGDKSQKFFKLLMPNKDAGTIIGKAGATIQLIQKKSGARVKVSNATDFSPWTEARVVGITGPKNKIARAIAAILSEVFDDHEQRKTATGKSATPVGSESITAQILIPELSCGLVRALLNKMEADSSAKIKLTPQNKQPPGTQERILTVFGNIQQVSDGAEAVVNTIYEDPECKYINSSTEYQQGGNSNQGGNNHNGGSGGTPRAAMPRGGRGGQMQTSGNFDLQDPNVAAFQGNFNQGNNQGNNQNNNRGNNNNNNGNTQDNNFGNNNGNSLNGSFGGNQNQGNLGLGGWAGSIDAGAWTNCTGCGKLTDPSWPACPTCGVAPAQRWN